MTCFELEPLDGDEVCRPLGKARGAVGGVAPMRACCGEDGTVGEVGRGGEVVDMDPNNALGPFGGALPDIEPA